jgi:hypothetical protein
MKARYGSLEVDGTPEEIGALIRSLGLDVTSTSTPPVKKPENGREFVSVDVAFRALKRRPLSHEQSLILKLLRDHHPSWTSAKVLQEAAGYSRSQFAGLLGAFGKRVAATEGYKTGTWFFDQQWDYDLDCNVYRLPDDVLTAVQRAGL